MALYDQDVSTVTDNLSTDQGLDQDTAAGIEELLQNQDTVSIEDYDPGQAVSPGVDVLNVGAGISLTGNIDSPIIVLDQNSGDADFTVDNAAPSVVIAGGGNDSITATGAGNVTIETGGGNDTVTTGTGDDNIYVGDGSATVDAGGGDDTIRLAGTGNDSVDGGAGSDTIELAGGAGHDTIDGGEGFDIVSLSDAQANHTVTQDQDGDVTVQSVPTLLKNVEVIQFTDAISVLADSSVKAAAARLYEVLFDREADTDGLEYWFNAADSGASLGDIAKGFVGSAEFEAEFGSGSNEDFLAKLYQGMAGREGDAEGLAYWLEQMDNGLSKAEVAGYFADSTEAIQLMGIDGTQYVIDTDSE